MNDLINRLLLAAENRPDIRPLLQEAANEIASLKSRIEIRASLPEAPAVPVVKALKWTDHPAGGKQALAAGLGLYRVHANGDDWYLVPAHMGKGGKAAAQADFEARIRAVLATPPAPTAAVDGEVKPTERNKLVIDAYRAMDAIDAIRKWCDEQKYGNNTITVSRLRDMLPAVIRGRPQQFNVNTLVKKLRSQWGFGPSARSTLPIEWQQALDEAAGALIALSKSHLSPGTAEEERP